MSALRPPALRFAPLALILAFAACDERTPSTPPPGAVPSALRVSAGDGQTGVVGAELPGEIAVEVVDAEGRAMAGIAVRFAVVAGGGRVAAETGTSDASGVARTRWTLGTVAADSQVVEARLGQAAAVRLRASVRADAPASLALAGGGGRAGAVGGALADSLAVTARDRYGNPVAGLEVAWAAVAGGGSLSPARTATGADGTARTRWTLGPRVDSVQVALARVAGLDSVAFTAHAATAGVPLVLAKRSGDGQRGTAGGVLADSLGVLLRMPDGRPVVGALVAWSVPPAAGVVSPAVARTDANGAASAVWRLGTTPGLAQATARVDSGTLVFTSLTQADVPAGVAAVSGGGTAGVGQALADSLAVRVTDRHGNPAAGATVDWSATAGGGAVSPARSTAGADGIARAQWTLGPAAGAQSARGGVAGLAPVAFNATGGIVGLPLQLAKRGGDGQRGPVGSLLADSLGVVLRLPDGRGVSGALVRWSVPDGAGTVTPAESRTDKDGMASTTWRVGMAPGLVQAKATVDEGTLHFTARVEADAPTRVEVVGSAAREGPVGAELADSLAVRVTDRHGNPVEGQAVDWSVVSGGGALGPARGTTGTDGIARARWTLGPVAEAPQTARAAVAGLAPAAFSAIGRTAGAPLQLAKRGGDGQRGTVGSLLADSLAVTLRLPDGRGVAGARVRWSVPPGGGAVAPAESRTDANGMASATWRLRAETGLAQATATVDDGTLVFTALAEAEPPAAVEIAGGDSVAGPVGGAAADSLAVRVTDRHGNPVAGAAVAWAANAGNGTVLPARGVTDAGGIARAAWTLGMVADSAQGATARVGTLAPATFRGTATTAGVALLVTRAAGHAQTGEVAAVLADSLVVRVRTPAGVAVRNAAVAWSAAGGSLSPAAGRTDALGFARAAWTLPGTPGPAGATAASEGVSAVFSATAAPRPAAGMEVVEGDGQSVTRGVLLNPVVRVVDRTGAPVPRVTVRWGVLAGGGSTTAATSVTASDGTARAGWILGLTPGANRLRAAVAGVDSVELTATGVDAPLTLVKVGPLGLVPTSEIPFHRSQAVNRTVYVDVVDPAGRSVRGASADVRWAPNMGEAGRTGGFSFPWIGRITEDDNEIPRVFAHYEDQVVEFRTPWDAGMRLFWGYPYFDSPDPVLAHDTVPLVIDVSEASGLQVPIGLPVILYDDEGWVDTLQVPFDYSFRWPVGGRTGTRSFTVCPIEVGYQGCGELRLEVEPRPEGGAAAGRSRTVSPRPATRTPQRGRGTAPARPVPRPSP